MDPFDRRALLGAAGLLGVAALARSSRAGPLDPPAGPVAPTAKPLTQVEPRTAITALPITISQPGSYYLAQSFTVASATAITITADNVTVDLMGFTLTGTGAGLFSGVKATGVRRGLWVRNGTIRGFGESGVHFREADACRIEDLLVESCAESGIAFTNGTVARCICRLNSESGFLILGSGSSVLRSSLFIECRATENTNDGFKLDAGTGNNSGGCMLRDCIASQNGLRGFFADFDFVLERCLARQNTNSGFVCSDGCHLDGCVAHRNGSRGFEGGTNLTIHNCIARGNTLSGFKVNSACHITACQAIGNGIGVAGEAGFQLGGSNVVEGNYALSNPLGIYADTNAGNVIVHNVCIGNGPSMASNYSVAAGNQIGPTYSVITGINSVLNPYSNIMLHSVP